MANSWSNPSLAPPADIMNRAHALARYPYKAAHVDELSFEPGDTLLLEREVDNDWVAAVNTRTGLSGGFLLVYGSAFLISKKLENLFD